ncbi:helix-hairpin-helix domain-containing protein [Chitinivorax sp. B]|uniref:helix-hairpin-helix domain-containing protein n=1 Tax=Chitinivorax sp. B TaxID=2502235 RepID=UPI0014856B22|nr:helix-hairpin-helix domain-containing protein [Chitinivorax sp. B]
MDLNDDQAKRDLMRIPGIGKACAADLLQLGYRSVASLNGEDPEQMYVRLCDMQGQVVDRCMLYVFRCAVYFASHARHEPDKLKWWNWKDSN